jgi:DNA repair protein RecO (recombination protein O)
MSGTPKALYRDEGVVLRTQKLGEADRIVTVLTRRHGKVRAVAKGVRRTKSKFGSRLEPFSHVDLQLYTAYTAGTAVLETADRLTAEEKEPSLRLFLLVIGALRALADRTHPAGLVLDAFLLRAMSVAGWEPALSDCARCAEAGPHRHFSVPAGGMVCPSCRPTGSAMPNPVTIQLLDALLSGEWELAEASQGTNRREASGLVAALLQWHLERGLRSLALVDRS